ncbi:MAG: HdeD family acid-resistance protein [Chloroflexota bacterium]
MLGMLARNWWAVALRGLLAVIFGVLAFVWPGITLGALVLLFGAYALVDGIFALIGAVRAGSGQNRSPLVLEGIAGVAAGVLTFIWPGITALVLLYLIATWAIVTGVLEVWAAIRLREEISNEWLLGLGGVASILFGILLVIFPGAGALTVVWLIAAYAVVFGVLLIALGFRLRGWQQLSGHSAAAERSAASGQPAA